MGSTSSLNGPKGDGASNGRLGIRGVDPSDQQGLVMMLVVLLVVVGTCRRTLSPSQASRAQKSGNRRAETHPHPTATTPAVSVAVAVDSSRSVVAGGYRPVPGPRQSQSPFACSVRTRKEMSWIYNSVCSRALRTDRRKDKGIDEMLARTPTRMS